MSTRFVQDALDIMRLAIGRRNTNDPDSSDDTLLKYLNNFVSLSMPNDTKLFESFGTLTFTIDETTTTSTEVINGVITIKDAGLENGQEFMNISQEAYISLLDPEFNSISWNQLPIYQDPGEFFAIWGINNEEILIPGYPTMMLYYGDEFTFRTIPQKAYQVRIYGYKKNVDFPGVTEIIDGNDEDIALRYDYWLRYIAYGAAVDYARDFRFEPNSRSLIEATFKSERKLQLTHAHNQIKMSRAMPRF